jgi:hypothetical protein
MAHAVAALVEAARTAAMHEVFVAVFAVMVVVMLAAMAVFCVM